MRTTEVGFTLIELLIVIVVLGILAAIVVFSLTGVTGQSKPAACTSDAKTVEMAIDAYYADEQRPGSGHHRPSHANGRSPDTGRTSVRPDGDDHGQRLLDWLHRHRLGVVTISTSKGATNVPFDTTTGQADCAAL